MSPRKLLIAEKRREHSDFKHNTQRLNLFFEQERAHFFWTLLFFFVFEFDQFECF